MSKGQSILFIVEKYLAQRNIQTFYHKGFFFAEVLTSAGGASCPQSWASTTTMKKIISEFQQNFKLFWD